MAARTVLLFLLLRPLLTAADNPCALCHPQETAAYERTSMARSFYRPSAANGVEDFTDHNTYYHRASDTYFAMVRRDGKVYQQHYQIDRSGKRINDSEMQVDYTLGSGDHSRSYLHRTPANTLIELPLAWYSEKGGYWAMSPGYDRPDHQGFGRKVTYDCMFCHNGYPQIPAQHASPRDTPIFSSVPEGIDCERCHGDGNHHRELASTGASAEEIRRAIVNPARLEPDRRMEVCLQCHLETTSSALPPSIVRYERGPFSYRAGEPLAGFILHFDHAPGSGFDDKFEITGSAYRLRKSRCYLESKGQLTCTTCHNPHAAEPVGSRACAQCHAEKIRQMVAAKQHPVSPDCISCHMPKRRTEDVVHATLTDHYIRRQPLTGDPIAELAEVAKSYRGPVVRYYPNPFSKADDLYLAIAQVTQGSNLVNGLTQLKDAIRKLRPANAEYYLQLGDALLAAGSAEQAIAAYQDAIRHDSQSGHAYERLAMAQAALGQFAQAEKSLRSCLSLAPSAGAWVQLAVVQARSGRARDALESLNRAMALDADLPDAYNTAGAIQLEAGNIAAAEAYLRKALRIHPNYPAAHNNLGNLLSESSRFEEASYHFEEALLLQPNYPGARYDYALALARIHRYSEAQAQLRALLSLQPLNPDMRAEALKLLQQLTGK
jgi:tetratricopeptide (TPR) repeat protein